LLVEQFVVFSPEASIKLLPHSSRAAHNFNSDPLKFKLSKYVTLPYPGFEPETLGFQVGNATN
jgi:hypothetical protein